jgi:hypothetical protein
LLRAQSQSRRTSPLLALVDFVRLLGWGGVRRSVTPPLISFGGRVRPVRCLCVGFLSGLSVRPAGAFLNCKFLFVWVSLAPPDFVLRPLIRSPFWTRTDFFYFLFSLLSSPAADSRS